MAVEAHPADEIGNRAATFATTHWSVVLAAGQQKTPQATLALEQLCSTYWFPLYACVRHRGYGAEDAQDLTQEFLAHLLATHALAAVHPSKGRFRSFLLASLNHFLANEWDRVHAKKRGSGHTVISIETAEMQYQAELSKDLSPERIFERHWALTLLAQVTAHLREDYYATGKGEIFEALRVYLAGEKGLPYRDMAGKLGLSVDALRKAVQRLRERYGQLLREEITRTVSSPAEVNEEIRYLRTVLGER
jgi:DNA-directed RNA polymerase specialized sigma24 family protein